MMKRIITYLFFFSFSIQNLYSQQPFLCDGKLYFFRGADTMGGGKRMLSYIDNYTTPVPVVKDVCEVKADRPNALAASADDGYLYFSGDSGILYRLDMNCNIVPRCTIAISNKGCFDDKGLFWYQDSISKEFFAYDIKICSKVKGPYFISKLNSYADIVFNVYDCYLYMTRKDTTLKIDTNGIITDTLIGLGGNANIGGFAIGEDGNLFALDNFKDTSTLYSLNLTTLTASTIFSISPGFYFSDTNRASTDMASFPCNIIQTDFIADPDTSVCLYSPIEFRDTSQGFVTGWKWYLGDGDSSDVQNPTHSYSTAGTYLVELIASNNSAACLQKGVDTVCHNVLVYPLPVINVTADTVCAGDTITLSASGGMKYYWSKTENQGTVSFPKDTSAVLYDRIDDTTVYFAAGADNNNCVDTFPFMAVPLPNPKPEIIAEYKDGECYPLDVSLNYFLSTPAPIDSSYWLLDDNTTDTSSSLQHTFNFSPNEKYPASHRFILKTYYADGCSSSDTVEVEVCEDFFLPNVITPFPKDGQNDIYYIRGLGNQKCRLMVFNRWGQKVYEEMNYANDWDGSDFNNRPLNSDTYFTMFSCEDNYKTGWLKIINPGK